LAVSSPISLLGAGMAGNNNNLLYINSGVFPLGMDGQGWGYSSTTATLFPTSPNSSSTAASSTPIQLISGTVESTATLSTAYSMPSMTFVPYVGGSAPACALPSTTVYTFSAGGTVYVNRTVYVNTTVYVPVNNTVYVNVPGQNITTTVYVNQTVYVPGQNTTNTVYVNQTVYVPSSSSSSDTSLSKGAVAGIVIGCSIGLALLCLLCALVMLKSCTQKGDEKPVMVRGNQQSRASEASKIDNTAEPSGTGHGEVELVSSDV